MARQNHSAAPQNRSVKGQRRFVERQNHSVAGQREPAAEQNRPAKAQNLAARAQNQQKVNEIGLAPTAEAQRAIDLLQERRTALIVAAITGQIEVRHLAESLAA